MARSPMRQRAMGERVRVAARHRGSFFISRNGLVQGSSPVGDKTVNPVRDKRIRIPLRRKPCTLEPLGGVSSRHKAKGKYRCGVSRQRIALDGTPPFDESFFHPPLCPYEVENRMPRTSLCVLWVELNAAPEGAVC